MAIRTNDYGDRALRFTTIPGSQDGSGGSGGGNRLDGLDDTNVTEGPGIANYLLYWNNSTGFWEALPGLNLVDLLDVNITTGAGVDQYSVVWDQATGKFILKDVSGGGGGGDGKSITLATILAATGTGALYDRYSDTGWVTSLVNGPASGFFNGSPYMTAPNGATHVRITIMYNLVVGGVDHDFTVTVGRWPSGAATPLNPATSTYITTDSNLNTGADSFVASPIGGGEAGWVRTITTDWMECIDGDIWAAYIGGLNFGSVYCLRFTAEALFVTGGGGGGGLNRFDTLDDTNFTDGAGIDGKSVKYDDGTSKWITYTPTLVGLGDVNLATGPGTDGWSVVWDDGAGEFILVNVSSGSGVNNLYELNDVNVTEGAGIDGYFLVWDNGTTKWIAQNILGVAHGGTGANLGSTGGTNQVVQQATSGGAFTVGQLAPSALSQAGATTGQGILWNGSAWAPGTLSPSFNGCITTFTYPTYTPTFLVNVGGWSSAGLVTIPSGVTYALVVVNCNMQDTSGLNNTGAFTIQQSVSGSPGNPVASWGGILRSAGVFPSPFPKPASFTLVALIATAAGRTITMTATDTAGGFSLNGTLSVMKVG